MSRRRSTTSSPARASSAIDGIDHAVRAGCAVFIPGNAWHGTRNTGSEVLRLLYVFAVDSIADVTYVFPDGAGKPPE